TLSTGIAARPGPAPREGPGEVARPFARTRIRSRSLLYPDHAGPGGRGRRFADVRLHREAEVVFPVDQRVEAQRDAVRTVRAARLARQVQKLVAALLPAEVPGAREGVDRV